MTATLSNPQSTAVQICPSCHAVNPKAATPCPKCQCAWRPYKIVCSAGMFFTVMSSRERCTSLGDRHFFCIGTNIGGWTLFEEDQAITMHGSARNIGRKFERLLDTKALVAEIQRLVETGDKLPTDRRPPWVIDENRFRENQLALEAKRSGAKRQRVHDCGARY